MKQLQKELQAISKTLGRLSKKTEQMTKRLERLEKPSKAGRPKSTRRGPGRPPKKTAPRKSSGTTAIDALLKLIGKSKEGVRIEELRRKTGIGENNLRVSLYRLKKRGENTNAGKGVYIKA